MQGGAQGGGGALPSCTGRVGWRASEAHGGGLVLTRRTGGQVGAGRDLALTGRTGRGGGWC